MQKGRRYGNGGRKERGVKKEGLESKRNKRAAINSSSFRATITEAADTYVRIAMSRRQ